MNKAILDSSLSWETLCSQLPQAPRSYDTSDDPGFWASENVILCPSAADRDMLVDFLASLFKDTTFVLGYFSPDDDRENNDQDDCTGFGYIGVDPRTRFTE